MWKKSILILLCVSMFLASALSVSAKEDESKYTLAIDEETCNVSVLDEEGRVVISTNPQNPEEDEYTPAVALNNLNSQLIVTYYDSKNVDSSIGSYLSSVKQGTYEITKNGNTIRVDYDFSRKNEKFIIPVEYSLSGACLKITVLSDEIEEYGDKKINEIMVAPYLVRGAAEDNGYLLLPDGSGAKVDFSYVNPYASPYSGQIYGKDIGEALYYEEGNAKQVMLPIFGADYGSYGVLANVDGNAAAGYIEAECVGIGSSYAHAYASFVYRIFDVVTITGQDWQNKEYVAESEVVEKENFSVSYYIAEAGGIMSLASICKEIMTNLSETPDEPLTGALYAYGAATQRAAFLGVPYTETLKATTFEDISEMLTELTNENQSLAVIMQDFEKASLENKYPSGIKWSKYSGGEKAFQNLVEEYGDSHAFYSVQNLMYEESTSFMWLKQQRYAKAVSKESLARYTYSPVTYAGTKTDWYGLNLSKLTEKANKSLDKTANSECGVALQYWGEELYGDYSKSGGSSRNQFTVGMQQILEKQSENVNLAVDGGNAYAIGYADVYYNFPVSFSNYDMTTESVPFLQLVYHGSVNMVSTALNMTEEPEKELLQCVASGTIPCFAVTGMSNDDLRRSGYKSLFNTYFENQKETIAEVFDTTEDYYNKIYDQEIVSYECENDVSVTVYENGVKVVVNYSDQQVSYAGQEIPAMSFIFVNE